MNLLIKDFKVFINNKILLRIYLFVMITLTLMFSIKIDTKKTENQGARLGVCNLDSNNRYSNMLIDYFQNNKNFKSLVKITEGSEEELKKKFNSGELDCYIIIPEGFMDNLIDIKASPVQVRISEENSVTAIIVKNVLDSYETYVAAVQNNLVAMYDSMKNADIPKPMRKMINTQLSISLITKVLDKEGYFQYEYIESYSSISLIVYFEFAATVIILTFGSLFIGVELLKEKSYGVLKRYKSNGGNMLKFVSVKTVFYSIVLYMLILVPNLFASIFRGIDININLMLLYLWMIFFTVTLSLFIASITGRIRTYVLVANMVCIISILLGGGIIPSMYLPDNVVKISKFTPSYNFINTLTKVYSKMEVALFRNEIVIFLCISVLLLILSSVFVNRKEQE